MTNQSHTELAAQARTMAGRLTAEGIGIGSLLADLPRASELLRQCAVALESPERVQGEMAPYAWHYTNNGGASVWHMGPSNRLDADLAASKDFPRVHKVVAVYRDIHREETLPKIANELRIMLGSSIELYDGIGDIVGYQIKTGALHRILGLLSGVGHPVAIAAKSQSLHLRQHDGIEHSIREGVSGVSMQPGANVKPLACVRDNVDSSLPRLIQPTGLPLAGVGEIGGCAPTNDLVHLSSLNHGNDEIKATLSEEQRAKLMEAADHLSGDGHFMDAADADWAAEWLRAIVTKESSNANQA